jgi:phosphinothricin acetyltransferase
MTPLRIRAAAAGDIPAITRIYAHAVEYGTASFEIEPPDEGEMARRLRTMLESNYPYLVAEHAGAIAGYAYANAYRPRVAYRWCVEDSVYVAPELQGQRIGAQLLARLIEEAEARGYRQMIAVIGDSAQAPSIAVHTRAGFTHIGTLRSVGFKHGRWLDTVLMQRALGRGDGAPPSSDDFKSGLEAKSSRLTSPLRRGAGV